MQQASLARTWQSEYESREKVVVGATEGARRDQNLSSDWLIAALLVQGLQISQGCNPKGFNIFLYYNFGHSYEVQLFFNVPPQKDRHV